MTDITPSTSAPDSSPTLFEQLGGQDAVVAVVDLFYDRVLADPDLRSYFTDIDMGRLKQHQRRFIGQALGASSPYTGRSMRRAHERLAITDDAFDRVVTHLAGALAEAGVDEETVKTIAQALLPLKPEIVTA